MIDALDANARRAADGLTEVRAFVGTDPINSVIKLLEGLEGQYKADLEVVSVENLIPLQTALRQVAALRRSITADQYLDCKII